MWVVGRGRGFGPGSSWDLARIDPETNRRTAEVELGEFVGANWVATTPGATWASVSSPDRYGLARIDSRTNRVLGLAPLSRTRFPFLGRIAADDRSVWFVSALTVGRIDPRTNRLTASVHANSFERRLRGAPRLLRPRRRAWWSTATSGWPIRDTCDRSGREGTS